MGLRDPDPREFQEQRLRFQALQLSDRLNVSVPEVRILLEKSYNAFASGTNRTNSRVCFHSALVKDFSEPEIEGILGHELSHLHFNDCRLSATYNYVVTLFTLLQMIAFGIATVCFTVGFASGSVKGKKGSGGAALFGLGFLGAGLLLMLCHLSLYGGRFTARILQFALSRTAEYRGDLSFAKLIGKQKIIAALDHLSRRPEPGRVYPLMRSSLTVDPSQQIRNTMGFAESIFAAHPPLKKRIETLRTARIP